MSDGREEKAVYSIRGKSNRGHTATHDGLKKIITT
jgi:hypothetical protein